MVTVLVTSNAHKHDPSKWGKATAHAICPFDDTLEFDINRKHQAEAMRDRFTKILIRYHDSVQLIERELLNTDAKYIHSAFGCGDMLDSVMEELIDATKDTPWCFMWKREDVQECVRGIIDSHVRTNQQHERTDFAHAHADDPDCQQYLNFFEGSKP